VAPRQFGGDEVVNSAEKMDAIKVRGSRLSPEQSVILALAAAEQVSSIAMVYLESQGRLKTFYQIHEIFDQMGRVIRGKTALNVVQLKASRRAAEKQIKRLETSEDEAADVAADAIEVMVRVMEHLSDPSASPAVDAAMAACDVGSRLAEAVVESSGAEDVSPFVEGDAMVDRSLGSSLEVIENLENIPLDRLPQQAMLALEVAGSVNVKNGELMRSLTSDPSR
jgi:hypothetical protein